MKIGKIFQFAIGTYFNFIDLKNGHPTGLDIISYKYKIILELKMRTNTDNHSSKKTNFNKLSLFKKNNPEYLCIYGCINEKTEIKTKVGTIKKVIHNNQEIYIYSGYKLLKLIFKNNYIIIISFLQHIFSNYYKELLIYS